MTIPTKQKAAAIEEFIQTHFLDEHGCVYTFLDKATQRPPEDSFFDGCGKPTGALDFYVPGFTRREMALYENCAMCTGSYMMGLGYRYRLEKDSVALQRMRHGFEAIRRIFELGKQKEVGYFPKCYGDRYSEETSSDQYLYAMIAMDSFYEFADDKERAEISGMIPAMADFWLKRNYIRTYFSIKNLHWPLVRYPIFMLMAYNYSKDEKFLKEYQRLLSLWKEGYVNDRRMYFRPAPEYLSIFGLESRPEDLYVACGMPDYTTMRHNELEYLLNHDPENSLAADWKSALRDGWEQASLVITPEGRALTTAFVDRRLKQYRRATCSGRVSNLTGWSSMIIRAFVQAREFLPPIPEMDQMIENVLYKLDIENLTYNDEEELLPPQRRCSAHCLSGDAFGNWLWAYWKYRWQNEKKEN